MMKRKLMFLAIPIAWGLVWDKHAGRVVPKQS